MAAVIALYRSVCGVMSYVTRQKNDQGEGGPSRCRQNAVHNWVVNNPIPERHVSRRNEDGEKE